MKPRLLDLFCGAGGAALGYLAAGYEVVGIDIRPQPNYPGQFVKADVISYETAKWLDWADVVHASPPCQGYSSHVSSSSSQWAGTKGKDEPRLIPAVRSMLIESGRRYVIENVMSAGWDMADPILLCGWMFGLPIPRHRLFDANFRIVEPLHLSCRGVAKSFALAKGWDPRDMTVTGKGRHAGTKERWMEVMGWPADVPVTQHGLREAIPPAYTEYVGRQLRIALGMVA